MKRLLLLTVLLVIGYWIFRHNPPEGAVGPRASINKSGEPSEPEPSAPRPEPSRWGQLRSIIESDNVPIRFYGVVLDESGVPLPGVEVAWRVLKAGSFVPSLGLASRADGTMRTDAKGRFSVSESGSSINIGSLLKAGYREAPRMSRTYGYGSKSVPHQPDEGNPERFVMVKDGALASLNVNVLLKFDWDGSEKEFEIGTKTFSEKIILIPSKEPQKPGERGYNWKLILKAKNGQLILGKNGDAPLAPDSGYADEIVLKQNAGPGWWGNADALLYLKTNSGKYAEIKIIAYADRGMESSATGRLTLRWNPAGGRAFE